VVVHLVEKVEDKKGKKVLWWVSEGSSNSTAKYIISPFIFSQ